MCGNSTATNFHSNATVINSSICPSLSEDQHFDILDIVQKTKTGLCFFGALLNLVEILLFLSRELRNRSGVMLAVISASNLVMNVTIFYCTFGCEPEQPGSKEITIGTLQSLSIGHATYVLVWLSLERYLAVCQPLAMLIKPRFINCIVISSTIILAVAFTMVRSVTVGYIGAPKYVVHICRYVWLIIYNVLPAGILLGTMVPLMRTLQHRLSHSGTNVATTQKSRNATKIIVSVALLFVLTTALPRAICNIILIFDLKTNVAFNIFTVALVIELLGFASLDSAAYLAFNKAYRRKFLKTFCCQKQQNELLNSATDMSERGRQRELDYTNSLRGRKCSTAGPPEEQELLAVRKFTSDNVDRKLDT